MALAVIVGIAIATPGAPVEPRRAHAAQSVVVDVGSDWFCSAAFEGGMCETTVQVGDSVEWKFVEGSHNATECGDTWSKGNSCDGAEWKSAIVVPPPGTFSRVFDSAGTFYYRCTLHPDTMRGTVVVTAASIPAPTPLATSASSPSPTTTPVWTPTPATTASAPPPPQPDQSTQTPAGGSPASPPDSPVLGAGELPHGGGWPWTGESFDLVGLLFAINLPLAALSFSAFRWYLRRSSAA